MPLKRIHEGKLPGDQQFAFVNEETSRAALITFEDKVTGRRDDGEEVRPSQIVRILGPLTLSTLEVLASDTEVCDVAEEAAYYVDTPHGIVIDGEYPGNREQIAYHAAAFTLALEVESCALDTLSPRDRM